MEDASVHIESSKTPTTIYSPIYACITTCILLLCMQVWMTSKFRAAILAHTTHQMTILLPKMHLFGSTVPSKVHKVMSFHLMHPRTVASLQIKAVYATFGLFKKDHRLDAKHFRLKNALGIRKPGATCRVIKYTSITLSCIPQSHT